MITLTFGILKPQNGDKGSVFFPALEDNLQQLNDHNHDGFNSSKISSLGVLPTNAFVDLLAGDFTVLGNDVFEIEITAPAGVSNIDFFNPYYIVGNERIHPTFEKTDLAKFKIYTNAAYNMRVYFK